MLGACLRNILETCEISFTDQDETDIQRCPHFTTKKGIDLLHRLTLTVSQIEDFENRNRKLSTILNLCVALWGKLNFYSSSPELDNEYCRAMARKEALSQWLEESSDEAVLEETERALSLEDNNGRESYLEAIFSHLTARQISKSCELAQDKDDHHLALLLSQICLGNEISRQIMSQQLSNWAWAETDSFISTERLVLYTLLAGKATHSASHTEINTCLGLDWRRALGLHMWYACPTTATISEAMEMYEKAAGLLDTSTSTAYCDKPLPSYVENKSVPEHDKINYDVCFQLIKLYIDPSHALDQLLDSSSITSDAMAVCTSWILWCILQSLGYNHLSETKIDCLNTSMVSLLEAQGLWHWAAFVILCYRDEKRRELELRNLLNRHLLIEGEPGKDDPFYTEKEHFLVHYLKLPEQWLYAAKAVKAKTLWKTDEEAWYLIHCGQYNEAHKLIVEAIAPEAVVNEDHDHLATFLNEFNTESIQNAVTDWSNGGAIYRNYLDVIQQVEEMKQSRQPSVVKVERLRPRLLALCTRLINLKCTTAVHRLCVSEMSRMVVSVLRAILSDEPEGVRVLAQQISMLPLAHECALEELHLLTHHYLTQVSMES